MKTSDLFYGTVVKPYNSWSDIKLSSEATKIQTAMIDNSLFPDPSPTMLVFRDAVTNYVTQLAKAGTRDMNAVAAKNARRAELIALCIQLGSSVSTTANGDVESLVTSALPLRKQSQSVIITAPVNLRVTNGKNPGELQIKVDSMKGAVSFGFEYTQDPPTAESVWIKSICSTSRCTVKDLEPGKKYWFRTFVTGTKGQMVMGETLLSPYVQ